MLFTKTNELDQSHSNIDTKLSQMGLSTEAVEQAIKDGLIQYKRATPLHPATHGGATAWGEIVCTLREQLLSLNNGWAICQKSGLSITHNHELAVAVIVTSGDKDTGLVEGCPSTKNKKGPSTRNIVESNYTADMFDEDREVIHVSPIDSTQTWVLLYHFDFSLKEVRFELSLPASTARISGKEDKLKIDSWKDRIIFEPVSFSAENIENALDDIQFNDEVSFDITKKA